MYVRAPTMIIMVVAFLFRLCFETQRYVLSYVLCTVLLDDLTKRTGPAGKNRCVTNPLNLAFC